MGIIKRTVLAKANYLIVSLFAFISIFFTANSYANDKQDIAELEAFYHLVFEEQTKVKANTKRTRKILRSPKVIPTKQTNQKSKEKDPELVAFYESIFGSVSSEPDLAVAARKPTLQPKKQSLSNTNPKRVGTDNVKANNKKSKENPLLLQSTKLKPPKKESEAPTQATKGLTIDEKFNNEVISDEPITTINEVTTDSIQERLTSKKETKQGTGILDNNLLSSQVQKSDIKALFEKAFGKKRNENTGSSAKTNINSTSSNAPTNDMASLFAKAFGKKTATAIPSRVKVDFRINTTIIGECELFSNSSGYFDQVNTIELLDLLKEVLKEHVFLRTKELLGNNKKTQLSSLSKIGISALYNSTNLSLDVEIKPELRKPFILSLKRKKKSSVREENKVEAEKISGFLNSFTNVGLNSNNSKADLRMRLEGSLNINGFVLGTTSDYQNEVFNLGRTTLTYDIPEKLQRFTLGNISTGSRNFQRNIELDGIRISKEFFLDPDLQISPRGNEPLQLDTDSEVELYINNQLIRRFYLRAGVYALQDIGLYNGANNIRIRIKDEFGKVSVKTSKQFYDSHLLKPGLSLFAISVGYLSNQQSDLDKTPIFSGYYQKGISKGLTLSLDAQLSSDNYLLGAETISSIPIGSLKNSIAFSGGKERDFGYATSFEFRPNKIQEQISLDTLRQELLGLDTRSRGFLNSWSITGEYRSEDFSMLSDIDPVLTGTSQNVEDVNFGNRVFNSNKLRGNLQTNLSLNISEKWRGSLNIGAADYYDADASYYANLSATKRFNNGVRLSIGTRYDTEDEFSMNFQLSIPLSKKRGKKRVDLDVLADSQANSYETKLSVKPTSSVGSNSIGGSLEHFQDDSTRQQNLNLSYRNTNFETNLNARNRYSKSNDDYSQQLDVGFNTSIACVGSNCGTSYPIDDSFALVSGPSNQTQPIAISSESNRFKYSDGNDSGLPDNYTSIIPKKGRKAVVRLDSYRYQNIHIDEGTLPNGYDTEKTEFEVFPRYRQGFLVKAGGEPATIIDGVLVDIANKPLGFKGGQWIPLNTEAKTIAFFSNKAGRFRVNSMPAGKYKLELFDYPDMQAFNITVPDLKGAIHKLGNISINKNN